MSSASIQIAAEAARVAAGSVPDPEIRLTAMESSAQVNDSPVGPAPAWL